MQETFWMFYHVAGGYSYMGLFFLSLLFIFIIFRKERELWFYPNLLILLVLFNPIIIPILNRYFLTGGWIGGTTWRIWWIIPVPFLIAVTFTKVLDFVKGKEKIFVTIMLCIAIILSGNFVFNSDNFRRTENIFQLPSEVIDVSKMIRYDSEEQGITEHNVASVRAVSRRLRLYDPEIQMLFGRRSSHSNRPHAEEVASILNRERPNFEQLDSLLREGNVSYIVVNRQSLYELAEYQVRPEDLNYERIGSTERYVVYRTNF